MLIDKLSLEARFTGAKIRSGLSYALGNLVLPFGKICIYLFFFLVKLLNCLHFMS